MKAVNQRFANHPLATVIAVISGTLFCTQLAFGAEVKAAADNPFGELSTLNPIKKQQAGQYSPYADADFPRQVYWGDTHLHSSQSLDANSAGNQRLGQDQAYRFARGEAVTAHNNQRVRLQVPLDFLVIADHAEYLGLMPQITSADPALQLTAAGREILSRFQKDRASATALLHELAFAFVQSDPKFDTANLTFDNWKRNTAMADSFNQPGVFTAMIGYEWTSFPDGDNLHRVVIYRDGADKAAAMPPFSALDDMRPEKLWDFLEQYEHQTGGKILAIPHNGNVSNGLMFALQQSDGTPLTANYNRRRARWEPVVEVTQIKGDAETHPLLSPDDEFADFGTWDRGNLNVVAMNPKTVDMLPFEYARSALKLGLEQATITGVNPFKFGMIGSTDAHTSLATADEDNFWGKASAMEPGNPRRNTVFFKAKPDTDNPAIYSWQQVASGYAAVWATENTREALFDAMQRREVYATSGPRITLRFFGGWQFGEDAHLKPDVARTGYSTGVPMGADLPAKPKKAAAPEFLIMALKDPNGANLDRVQIVKGWQDAQGQLREKVYNAAASDERQVDDKGNVPALKSTVDLKNVSYRNSIGNTQLATVWRDPDFDPKLRAFYYARVLEIATPRWSEFDRKHYGGDTAKEAPRSIQERAYSSPIWYTP